VNVRDLILLLLGAIVGAAVNSWYTGSMSAVRRFLSRRRARRRAREDQRGVMTNRLLAYYRRQGLAQDLYQPVRLGRGGPIPLLVDPAWVWWHTVDIHKDQFICFDGKSKDRFPIDQRLIRRRKAQGARIFDDEIPYLKQMVQGRDGTIRLVAGNCNYFSYATLTLRLEAELRRRSHRTPLHDKHFRDAASSLAAPARPLGIGCSWVTIFRGKDGSYVAIQNRSAEVMNLSNVRTVVPTLDWKVT
jgi:hypothetical protein